MENVATFLVIRQILSVELLATVLGWGGAILDAGEALVSAAAISLFPELLSIADVAASYSSSYFAGETGSTKLHPSLPDMWVASQDVIWTISELAVPSAARGVATLAGSLAGGPVGGIAGFEFGNLVDVGTSYASFAYDTSRMLGIIPNRYALGFYLAPANTGVPIFTESGQPTVVIIIFGGYP